MVDSLQIGAAVIVVFVLALTTEILFACCRVYTWLRRQVRPSVKQVSWISLQSEQNLGGPRVAQQQYDICCGPAPDSSKPAGRCWGVANR